MPNVLLTTRILAGGVDLSARSDMVNVEATRSDKKTTSFASDGWDTFIGGISQGAIKASGFWEAGDATMVDDSRWAAQGANRPWSVYPSPGLTFAQSAGYGTTCYFTDAFQSSYKLLGKIDDVAPWEADLKSSWPLVRGLSIHPPGTARTATGNGTAVEHVAVSATQSLYAALHVLSVSGTTPSLTVKVQSDVDGAFGSPADQITFTAATAVGGEIKRTAVGAITDTFYRVSYTISGTTPSFLFVVSLGVA